MKKIMKITTALMLVAFGAFAINTLRTEYITFCHQKMGGPGLCIANGESGFICSPVNYLGDCEGTFAVELPPVE